MVISAPRANNFSQVNYLSQLVNLRLESCEAAPTNRSVPAKEASKMLYLLCNLGLVFTAIITSTFVRIVTGKLRMFRIIAVMATAIFPAWYSKHFVNVFSTSIPIKSLLSIL